MSLRSVAQGLSCLSLRVEGGGTVFTSVTSAIRPWRADARQLLWDPVSSVKAMEGTKRRPGRALEGSGLWTLWPLDSWEAELSPTLLATDWNYRLKYQLLGIKPDSGLISLEWDLGINLFKVP